MDAPDTSMLSLLKLTLQEKLETIRVLDSEIVELIDNEVAITTEIEQTDGYRDTMHSSLLKSERVLGKIVTPPTTNDCAPYPAPTTSKLKLPKLKLRPFGGELTQWTSFWEAEAHNNPDLRVLHLATITLCRMYTRVQLYKPTNRNVVAH